MYYLGIDIGGTSIKYGIINSEGRVLSNGSIKTSVTKTNNYILEDIDKIIELHLNEYKVEGVAISTAGVVDSIKGEIIYAGPSIPNYKGTEIKKHVLEKYNLKCSVENDVNSAALGELWIGAGKEKENIFCLTIGTGIGGACIINKKLLYGASNSAGEIGYINIHGNEVQNIASTKALVESVKEKINGEDIDGKFIFDSAKEGNEICIREIENVIEYIASLIININYVVNPELFILGGGIMEQENYIKPILESKISEKTKGTIFENINVTFAKAGNMAGVLGAVYKFREMEFEN